MLERALFAGDAEAARVALTGFVQHFRNEQLLFTPLANGTMGYTCDVEPHHPEGVLHPIAVMTPTALAVSEMTGASTRGVEPSWRVTTGSPGSTDRRSR